MYDNLKSLGITNPDEINRYSLRQEANNDILKIYFQKDKGEFFAKSVKFKYPRQRKTVVADGVGQGYEEVQEISPICATLSTSWIRSASAIALKSISSVKSSTIYAIWKAWSPIRSAKSKPIWKSSPVSKSIPAARCLAGLVVSIHSRQHASSRPGMARRYPAFFCLHVLALFVQLQRDIQQQPVVKATEIQAGQLRDTVQPVLQRIAMNKQRL